MPGKSFSVCGGRGEKAQSRDGITVRLARVDGRTDGGTDGWRRGRLAGCFYYVGVCLMVIPFCIVNST